MGILIVAIVETILKKDHIWISPKSKPTWRPARQFGEYNCDSPALLLNSTMQGIRDLHQNHLSFEFALFTGGTVDHSDRLFMSKTKTSFPKIPVIEFLNIIWIQLT